MSTAKMGALVQYCGHAGTFVADIFRVGNVNVVRANGPVTPDNLNRTNVRAASHQISDFPQAGFWRPDLGVFVVPHPQVRKLTKDPY